MDLFSPFYAQKPSKNDTMAISPYVILPQLQSLKPIQLGFCKSMATRNLAKNTCSIYFYKLLPHNRVPKISTPLKAGGLEFFLTLFGCRAFSLVIFLFIGVKSVKSSDTRNWGLQFLS